ncbi:MAG: hypothetical protein JNL70_13920 [Saprospiraceae bacterium]|nr:hypothetical protein [Saprospiraceae bacterium]
MEKKTNKNLNMALGWLITIILIVTLWLAAQTQKLKKEPYVTTRKTLSKLYEVDLKTFNKWIQIFSDPAILSFDTFSKQRGITQQQKDYLLALFGSPTQDKTKYSKAQIVAFEDDELHHAEYRTGRESIKKFFKKYNITPEMYAQLNFFPPRIGRELKRQMGC